jgi:diguanylate cyclase (GGDEF)-like protein
MEPRMEYARSWLCPEPADRERLLDMDYRLRKARMVAMAFLGAALLACGPWIGWWPVLVLLALAAGWRVVEQRVPHVPKPEWLLAAGWVSSCLAICTGILLTGGAHSPAKSWLLVPAIALPARFHRRGLNAGIVICVALLGVVTIVVSPDEVADAPQLFIFPGALIAAVMAMSTALRDAEVEHRAEVVIDPLTGMLNRKALESRTLELELQSRVTRQPVGLIICDIDQFKAVNDNFGHATGDAVLQGVAYRVRTELRAYDLAYRLGGEEFVVLVPGATPETARELAERLRYAIEAAPIHEVAVTASFGVAVSPPEGLDFKPLFDDADEALYRAKASGRNRVCTSESAAFAVLT